MDSCTGRCGGLTRGVIIFAHEDPEPSVAKLSLSRNGMKPALAVVMTKNYWEQRIFRISAACLLLGLTAQTNLDEPFGLPTVITAKGPLPAN